MNYDDWRTACPEEGHDEENEDCGCDECRQAQQEAQEAADDRALEDAYARGLIKED